MTYISVYVRVFAALDGTPIVDNDQQQSLKGTANFFISFALVLQTQTSSVPGRYTSYMMLTYANLDNLSKLHVGLW